MHQTSTSRRAQKVVCGLQARDRPGLLPALPASLVASLAEDQTVQTRHRKRSRGQGLPPSSQLSSRKAGSGTARN